MTANELYAFIILSFPVIYFSRRVILKPWKHGFPRFFSWECILLLFLNNYPYWFKNPFSILQILSWTCLIYCTYLVIVAVILFRKLGKAGKERKDNVLFNFEKTTELIKSGIYKYIRHPMYGSLIFITWGIFLKHVTAYSFILTGLSTVLLIITAKIEEKENLMYFGEDYRAYIHESRMFIPFIL